MKKKRISIVDDDIAIGRAIEELLKSVGTPSNVFCSAKDFLESACISQTSCLITDVKMPEIGGVELYKRALALGYRFPVIFISAHENDSIYKAVQKVGAVGFLIKPFRDDTLLNYIQIAIAEDAG